MGTVLGILFVLGILVFCAWLGAKNDKKVAEQREKKFRYILRDEIRKAFEENEKLPFEE